MKKYGIVAVCCLFLMAILTIPVSAANGYSKREIIVIGEPDTGNTKYVEYFEGDKEKSLEDLTWIDGRFGKAVELNGVDQYLRVPDYPLLVAEFSIAGWFCWYGDAAGDSQPDSQHCFSFCRDDQTLFTVFPYSISDSGKALGNRICLKKKDSTDWNIDYSRRTTSKTPVAWPINEWHHLAITMDGNTLCYYVDGQLMYRELWVLGFADMRFEELLIGESTESDPAFHGAIDELSIYNTALTQAQIERLAAGISIQDKTTPTTAAPTTTIIPTTVTTTTLPGAPQFKKQIPLAVPITIAGGAVVAILAALLFKKRTL